MKLRFDDKNANRGTERGRELVRKSLQKYGAGRSILVDKNGKVIAGNKTLEQAIAEGIEIEMVKSDGKRLIVHQRTDLDLDKDPAARELAIADNRTSEIGLDWDFDLLAEMDGNFLSEFDFDPNDFFESNGFEGNTDPDEVPEKVETRCKPGDLWQLGRHRLLCGDATNADDVGRLMNKEKADIVFTDPPYNVDYGSSKNPRHKIRSIENDKQGKNEWEEFNIALINNIRIYNKGDIYVWGASGPEGMKQRLIFTEQGFHWSATIIWNKQQLILSPSNYQRRYEPCFYGWLNQSSFCGDRKQVEVWDIDRPLKSDLHPTMKPVELCERGILNSSKPNNIIWDGFFGSGSTLIAAEKTGRICYGMEIDPHYCDVTIQRWENFTGQTAERING